VDIIRREKNKGAPVQKTDASFILPTLKNFA